MRFPKKKVNKNEGNEVKYSVRDFSERLCEAFSKKNRLHE